MAARVAACRRAAVGEDDLFDADVARTVIDDLDVCPVAGPHRHVHRPPLQSVAVVHLERQAAVDRVADQLVTVDDEVHLPFLTQHAEVDLLGVQRKGLRAQHALQLAADQRAVRDARPHDRFNGLLGVALHDHVACPARAVAEGGPRDEPVPIGFLAEIGECDVLRPVGGRR